MYTNRKVSTQTLRVLGSGTLNLFIDHPVASRLRFKPAKLKLPVVEFTW